LTFILQKDLILIPTLLLQFPKTTTLVILVMDNNDINHINSSMPQIPVELHKFYTYLAYLMEFGYNLSIRPTVNMSENPRFETIAGLFGSSG
jgi:hypothetical protein